MIETSADRLRIRYLEIRSRTGLRAIDPAPTMRRWRDSCANCGHKGKGRGPEPWVMRRDRHTGELVARCRSCGWEWTHEHVPMLRSFPGRRRMRAPRRPARRQPEYTTLDAATQLSLAFRDLTPWEEAVWDVYLVGGWQTTQQDRRSYAAVASAVRSQYTRDDRRRRWPHEPDPPNEHQVKYLIRRARLKVDRWLREQGGRRRLEGGA